MQSYTKLGFESELVAATSGKEPRAARDLIEHFHERMSRGQPYDKDMLHRYMKHVFHQIVAENKSADAAFGLKLRRGEHVRPDTTERDVIAAAYMERGRRRKDNWLGTKGGAVNLLFKEDKGEKAVEEADKKYRDILQHMPDEMLELILRTS